MRAAKKAAEEAEKAKEAAELKKVERKSEEKARKAEAENARILARGNLPDYIQKSVVDKFPEGAKKP
jgi:hypothetical protein